MNLWNISLHAASIDRLISTNHVYVAINAPNFCSKKECDIWRKRVSKYVYNRRKSLDYEADEEQGYSVVYVPEVLIEGDEPIEVDSDFNDDDILFAIKRPDGFDDESSLQLASEFNVPGHYTVMVVHNYQKLAERHVAADTKMDVASDAFRMFGWFLFFILSFAASAAVIKLNPHSMLGMY